MKPFRLGLWVCAFGTILWGCAPSEQTAVHMPAAEPAAPQPAAQQATAQRSNTKGRTATQFAEDWRQVLRTANAARHAAGVQMSADWEGRPVEWTGRLMASLCNKAMPTCAFNPFAGTATAAADRLGGLRVIVDLGPAEHDRLMKGCKAQPVCVMTVRGRLSQLRTTPGEPVRVHIASATVIAARPPHPTERWDRPAPRRLAKDGTQPKSTVRTGTPTPLPFSLKPAVF